MSPFAFVFGVKCLAVRCVVLFGFFHMCGTFPWWLANQHFVHDCLEWNSASYARFLSLLKENVLQNLDLYKPNQTVSAASGWTDEVGGGVVVYLNTVGQAKHSLAIRPSTTTNEFLPQCLMLIVVGIVALDVVGIVVLMIVVIVALDVIVTVNLMIVVIVVLMMIVGVVIVLVVVVVVVIVGIDGDASSVLLLVVVVSWCSHTILLTKGTTVASLKPHLETIHVKHVLAGQSPHPVSILQRNKANCTSDFVFFFFFVFFVVVLFGGCCVMLLLLLLIIIITTKRFSTTLVGISMFVCRASRETYFGEEPPCLGLLFVLAFVTVDSSLECQRCGFRHGSILVITIVVRVVVLDAENESLGIKVDG